MNTQISNWQPAVRIEDVRNAVQDVAQGSLNLVFIFRDPQESDGSEHGACQPMNIQITETVCGQFRETFSRHLSRISRVKDLKILPFHLGGAMQLNLPPQDAKTEGLGLEAVPVDRVPAMAALLREIGDGGVPKLDTLTELGAQQIDRLWAYAVVAVHEGRTLSYFRKFKPSKVIRAGGWLRLVYHDGLLSTVQEDIFNFDQEADVIIVGQDALVLHRAYFEEIFDFVQDVYEPLARKAIERSEMSTLLSDPEELLEACKRDDRKLRKLAAIQENVEPTKLTWDNVRDVVNRWNVDVKLDEEAQKVIVTPGSAWEILRILDDDYLRSDITNKLYEAYAKRFVGRWGDRRPKRGKQTADLPPPPAPPAASAAFDLAGQK